MPSAAMTPAEAKAQWEMLKSRRGLWLFPVLAALFIGVTTLWLLMPLFGEIVEIRDENKQLAERLDRLTEKRAQLQSLNETDLDRQLALVVRALPNAKPLIPLLGLLEVRTTDNGMVLGEYSLNPGGVASESANEKQAEVVESQPGTLSFLPITMKLVGTFDSFYGFMLSMNQAAPLVQMSELSLSDFVEDGGMPGSKEIAVDSVMQVYYSLPPRLISGVDEPLPDFGPAQQETLRALENLTASELQHILTPDLVQERENPFTY